MSDLFLEGTEKIIYMRIGCVATIILVIGIAIGVLLS
jgi:hypothetical protein